MLDFKSTWDHAATFDEFVAACRPQYCGLWQGVYHLARIPEWARDAATGQARRKLLVIAEDWCGDASNTVPVIAKLVDEAPRLELRIIQRDSHPEVMNHYLTNGTRSIPIIIALDELYRQIGYWGPRPTELQAWVITNRAVIPKAELYPQVRKWYARDRGETTIREVLAVAGLGPTAAARTSNQCPS